MPRTTTMIWLLCVVTLSGPHAWPADAVDAEEVLKTAEVAFAQTMADRDLAAFADFVAPGAVFFSGAAEIRGREAVVAAWAPLFEDEEAPFSWHPEQVAVLPSGDLGFSTGPVVAPDGTQIGTFNSVWKRGADGRWRVVFDRGCPN
jgi:ketosteroid isomerase-like protein